VSHLFFNSWSRLLRTLSVDVMAYVALVAFVRVADNGSFSKLNACDFVVTIALGGTLATIPH
jgi:uncharacterized membrane protein YcaP (DUF421 family)